MQVGNEDDLQPRKFSAAFCRFNAVIRHLDVLRVRQAVHADKDRADKNSRTGNAEAQAVPHDLFCRNMGQAQDQAHQFADDNEKRQIQENAHPEIPQGFHESLCLSCRHQESDDRRGHQKKEKDGKSNLNRSQFKETDHRLQPVKTVQHDQDIRRDIKRCDKYSSHCFSPYGSSFAMGSRRKPSVFSISPSSQNFASSGRIGSSAVFSIPCFLAMLSVFPLPNT